MNNQNWTGNKTSIFTAIGASSHSATERETNDFYATHPKEVEKLLQVETFNKNIFEPCVGQGHIANVLKASGYKVKAADLVYRGYIGTVVADFLKTEYHELIDCDIITNPPYKYAQEFLEKSLEIIPTGNKVAMLLKLTFLEGQKRQTMFKKYPPKYIYVHSARALCAKNGEFEKYPSSAVAYAWFIWVKGNKAEPIVRWL